MSIIAAIVLAVGLLLFSEWQRGKIEGQFPPSGRFVLLDGGKIHVTERLPDGEPSATIVLLHGSSANQADIMNALGDRLARLGYRVVAPDRPGHGWSDRIAGSAAASPGVQARLLHQAFDAMGIHHAVVVGHSWGSALAVDFALRHAEFTRGLVLLAPVTHPSQERIRWYNAAAVVPGLGTFITRFLALPVGLTQVDRALGRVFAPDAAPPNYIRQHGTLLALRPSQFRADSQDLSVLRAFVARQTPMLPDIRVPVAIVAGEHDRVVDARVHAYGSSRDIPGATLTLLPGVGHSPHHSDPDRVVAAIEDVVRRTQDS
jgi:pimeloyl-ACP methyl ester carboxylesterase